MRKWSEVCSGALCIVVLNTLSLRFDTVGLIPYCNLCARAPILKRTHTHHVSEDSSGVEQCLLERLDQSPCDTVVGCRHGQFRTTSVGLQWVELIVLFCRFPFRQKGAEEGHNRTSKSYRALLLRWSSGLDIYRGCVPSSCVSPISWSCHMPTRRWRTSLCRYQRPTA